MSASLGFAFCDCARWNDYTHRRRPRVDGLVASKAICKVQQKRFYYVPSNFLIINRMRGSPTYSHRNGWRHFNSFIWCARMTALSWNELRTQENNEHFISIHNSLLYKSFIYWVRVWPGADCTLSPLSPLSLSTLATNLVYYFLLRRVEHLFRLPVVGRASDVSIVVYSTQSYARNARMRLLFCAKRISLTRQKQQ